MFRTYPRTSLSIAIAAVGAALAALFSGGTASAQTCANVSAAATVSSSAQIRSAVRCLINAERAARGLASLRADGDLRRAAHLHAADMVRRRYFAHVSPEGRSVAQRVKRTGYLRGARRWAVGEDIGWGTGTSASAQGIVTAWMKSPPHRAVILNGRYRELGLGVAGGIPSGGAGATFVLDAGVVR